LSSGIKNTLQRHFPAALRVARSALKAPYIRYCFHRPQGSLKAVGAFSKGESVADDKQLIDRLVASYARRREAPSGQWSEIFMTRHSDIHEAFSSGNRHRIEEILRDPITSDLMYGFDSTAKSLRAGGLRIEDRRAPALTLDALATFAEAIGARPLDFPENYYVGRLREIRADDIIDEIEKALGFGLRIPNPYPEEYGLDSKRGVISYRVPQAVYQAWRISRLVAGIANPKVLEIGGGLGRTALYARQFGITDYTIVDIPISSLAQGYFLGRTVGEQNVALFGEPGGADKIKLISPGSFFEGAERYDLIVNVDSLTEIGKAAAEQYWNAIQQRAARFLSINHEANEFTVAQLIGSREYSRMPYWMRNGYVEEVVAFQRTSL
jgi:hypothetical protein